MDVCVCKIVLGTCAALFDQMVPYPVVESIKVLTVWYIHSPKSCCQSKTFGFDREQKLQGSFFRHWGT